MRKELNITITEEGRDKGKVFKLKELPALQVEKWCQKAISGISKRAAIPDEISKMGSLGVFALGYYRFANMDWSDLEPLLDEMLICVVHIPTPSQPNISVPLMIDTIEEVKTIVFLRQEIFKLHLDFLPPAAQ